MSCVVFDLLSTNFVGRHEFMVPLRRSCTNPNNSGLVNMFLRFHIWVAGLYALGTTTASPLNKRTAHTSPPGGCLVVSTSPSSGQYSDMNDAIAALGSGSSSKSACIFVYAGTYTVGSDQIYINYAGNLTLYGETAK